MGSLQEAIVVLVVIIQKSYELSTRVEQPGVSSGGGTTVFRSGNVAHPRIGEALHHRGCVIGGAVVDHKELEILECLTEDASDRSREEIRPIERGNQDRECGRQSSIHVAVFGWGATVNPKRALLPVQERARLEVGETSPIVDATIEGRHGLCDRPEGSSAGKVGAD